MPMIITAALSLVIFTAQNVLAQNPTLRERVERRNGNVSLHINVDGEPATLTEMLADTDIIVRARIGRAAARLSSDGRDITTTYDLLEPKIAFPANAAVIPRPGATAPVIALTEPGGTVAIDQFTATITYDDTPQLEAGTEIVALLKNRGGQYFPAAHAGLFGVREGQIITLMPHPGEERRFSGMRAESFIAHVVTERQRVK